MSCPSRPPAALFSLPSLLPPLLPSLPVFLTRLPSPRSTAQESINDHIQVLAPFAGRAKRDGGKVPEGAGEEGDGAGEEGKGAGEEVEVYVCRRFYHTTRAAFLNLGPKAMAPEVRGERRREGGRDKNAENKFSRRPGLWRQGVSYR